MTVVFLVAGRGSAGRNFPAHFRGEDAASSRGRKVCITCVRPVALSPLGQLPRSEMDQAVSSSPVPRWWRAQIEPRMRRQTRTPTAQSVARSQRPRLVASSFDLPVCPCRFKLRRTKLETNPKREIRMIETVQPAVSNFEFRISDFKIPWSSCHPSHLPDLPA